MPPPTRGERAAWALFDFANSAFPTVVITFVYSAFFAKVLAGDATTGTTRGAELWSLSQTVCGVGVAVAAPILGALVDQRRGRKKTWSFWLSAVTVGCTIALAWPAVDPTVGAATESALWAAWGLVTVANIAFELMFVIYNAFLPGLGDQKTVGRLSGIGWAFGYVGGLLCLAIGLGMVGVDGFGPWVTEAGDWNVRATNLLVAAWFALFSVPFFVMVRDRGGPVSGIGSARLVDSVREVGHTIRSLRHYPDLTRLLAARLFYNDALIAIFGLAAIYMTGTLGMEIGDAMLVGIWLNIVSALGAVAFGYVDDKIGSKVAIVWSVVLVTAGTVLAIALPTPGWFWVAATIAGIGLGPSQSASRSLLARFVSPARSGEFYGLFALTGKATTWAGPLLFFVVTSATGSQRWGLTPLVAMLGIGLVLVVRVDERRGIERAREDRPADGAVGDA